MFVRWELRQAGTPNTGMFVLTMGAAVDSPSPTPPSECVRRFSGSAMRTGRSDTDQAILGTDFVTCGPGHLHRYF